MCVQCWDYQRCLLSSALFSNYWGFLIFKIDCVSCSFNHCLLYLCSYLKMLSFLFFFPELCTFKNLLCIYKDGVVVHPTVLNLHKNPLLGIPASLSPMLFSLTSFHWGVQPHSWSSLFYKSTAKFRPWFLLWVWMW